MSEVMQEKEETDVKDVKDMKDVEAAVTPLKEVTANTFVDARHNSIIDEIARSRAIQNSIKPLRYMRQGEEWLDAKMGVETQGIDRIPEEDKNPPSIFNSFFMWWSMTCHLGTLPIGILGPEFGLDLRQSIAAIVVGTFLGALCTAYTGTLGPKVREFPVLVSRTSLSNPLTNSMSSLVSVPSLPPDIPLASGAPNCALFSTSSSEGVLLLSTSSFVVKPLAPSRTIL
jgi:Permease for cytosine/purines, uracil, thiamine, allantoin